MSYIDGFVVPVPKANLAAYKKLARKAGKIWMEHGALDYYECIGDDLKVPWGLTFPKMCKLKAGETAIFAFIVYKSKAHRNQVNARVMTDPRMTMEGIKMPFDEKRFATGGFKVVVKAP